MKFGIRGLTVLVGAAGLAAITVSVPAAHAAPAGSGSSNSVSNPYSPSYKHPYRHGAMPTLSGHAKMQAWDASHPTPSVATGTQTLSYGGGNHGIGVQSGHSKVYLVFYGTQWGTKSTDANGNAKFTNDAAGAAAAAQNVFKGIGNNGELWSAELTQWCDGPNVAAGATSCPANAAFIPYQSGGVLSGVWYDNAAASPSAATGHQLGVEAVKAASHFGNTTAASNRYAYYVILSAHGTNPDNYQGQYCAWHDWNGDTTLSGGGAVSSGVGDVAFSNQPYNIDSGQGCGQNFVNSGTAGTLDGFNMSVGHEWHEMMSDQNPAGGWTNHTGSSYNGQENSDECAYKSSGTGQAINITFSTGTYAEQGSWSNDTNACATSHPIVTHSAVTVTNPGNKSSVINVSTSLQIHATDANGKALTYSATGLPTGLTINASTGLISGKPTALGTFASKVTAKDTAGATGSASFSWAITSTACSGTLLTNRGFESGASGWSGTTTAVFTDGTYAHTGVGYLFLDGYGDGVSHTETLSQSVTPKSGCTATLSFYLWISSNEGTTTAYDKLSIKANGTTIKTYSNVNQTAGYVKKSINISAYAGSSVKITFSGFEDATLATAFLIDDTAVTIS